MKKAVSYRNTFESVPGTNQYWAMSIKFLAQGNNRQSLTGFEPMWLAIIRLLVRHANHLTTPSLVISFFEVLTNYWLCFYQIDITYILYRKFHIQHKIDKKDLPLDPKLLNLDGSRHETPSEGLVVASAWKKVFLTC